MTTIDRYARQTLFGPVGKQGQERLQALTVTIIGCGALGTALPPLGRLADAHRVEPRRVAGVAGNRMHVRPDQSADASE